MKVPSFEGTLKVRMKVEYYERRHILSLLPYYLIGVLEFNQVGLTLITTIPYEMISYHL